MNKSFQQYLTELDHLHDAFDKKGVEFVENLLAKNIVVSIKVDSAAFVVQNDNGTLRFFGRDGRVELDEVRRTAVNLYERAVEYMSSKNWQKLPNGVKFFMEMFSSDLEPVIKYRVSPKSGFVMLFAQENGKNLRPDHPYVQKAANILDVEAPPIIFSGKLSVKNKDKILEFISTPEEKRVERFGLDNFTNLVLEMFMPRDEVQWMIQDGLEGLVFFFGNDSQPVSFKMVDPAFTKRIKSKKKEGSDTVYPERIVDITWRYVPSVLNTAIQNKSVKGIPSNKTQAYIETATEIVAAVVKKYNSQINKEIGHLKDEALGNRFLRVNQKNLPQDFRKLMSRIWYAEDMFRLVLMGLQKEKVRANPRMGITKEVKEKINNSVKILRSNGIVD